MSKITGIMFWVTIGFLGGLFKWATIQIGWQRGLAVVLTIAVALGILKIADIALRPPSDPRHLGPKCRPVFISVAADKTLDFQFGQREFAVAFGVLNGLPAGDVDSWLSAPR